MADFSHQELLACVQREIGLRERVYPRFIQSGKIKADKAEYELAAMRAVLEKLKAAPG